MNKCEPMARWANSKTKLTRPQEQSTERPPICCRFVVVLLPGSYGTHIELGFAIARGKKVFLHSEESLVFELGSQTNAFYHHPDVTALCSVPLLMLARCYIPYLQISLCISRLRTITAVNSGTFMKKDIRWKQRFQNFEKAFLFLKKATDRTCLFR